MRMAVSKSLRHIVWLQRFDGHTETKITISVKTHFVHSDVTTVVIFLTFSVVILYLHSHFLFAVHPGQPPFLGG